MTEFNKCTCVKVNKEKMDLIKSRGINLQDLLDEAMDMELNINKDEIKQSKIQKINEEIEKVEKEKEEKMIYCQKKIDTLMKNLIESKEHEEEVYNKKIEYLKRKKRYMEKTLNSI